MWSGAGGVVALWRHTSSAKSKLSGTGSSISSSLQAKRESLDFHMPGAESAMGSSSASLEACAPIRVGCPLRLGWLGVPAGRDKQESSESLSVRARLRWFCSQTTCFRVCKNFLDLHCRSVGWCVLRFPSYLPRVC